MRTSLLFAVALIGCHTDPPKETGFPRETGETGYPSDKCVLFADSDGDGHGDPLNSITDDCGAAPSGFTDNQDDCDDTDSSFPTIHHKRIVVSGLLGQEPHSDAPR